MSCRTCVHLDVLPNKAGKIVPRKGRMYPCRAPIPDLKSLGLPQSVTGAYRFQWPPHTVRMEPDDDQNCPTYSPRPTQKEMDGEQGIPTIRCG